MHNGVWEDYLSLLDVLPNQSVIYCSILLWYCKDLRMHFSNLALCQIIWIWCLDAHICSLNVRGLSLLNVSFVFLYSLSFIFHGYCSKGVFRSMNVGVACWWLRIRNCYNVNVLLKQPKSNYKILTLHFTRYRNLCSTTYLYS